MTKTIILLTILIVGVISGLLLSNHQSSVLIQTDNYNVETNITVLLIILILTVMVLFIIEWILRYIFHISNRFTNRKRHYARKQTEKALLKLAEGDYKQAEKLMSENADHAEQPIVNYLLAAVAAQKDGNEIRANQHLKRASELTEKDNIPLEITRVRLQLAYNKNIDALRGIIHLLKIVPYHPEVLRLAEQTYIRNESWNLLLDIIPFMKKAKVRDEKQCKDLQQRAWIGLIDQLYTSQGSDGLKTWWKKQSYKTRRIVSLQIRMAEYLIKDKDHDTAQNVILYGLKRKYDDRLIMIIPHLKVKNLEKIEKILRKQIQTTVDCPLLWSIMGQCLMKHGKWKEASTAFRTALKQRPDPFDYAYLAETLEKLHLSKEAETMRRNGLLLLALRHHPLRQ